LPVTVWAIFWRGIGMPNGIEGGISSLLYNVLGEEENIRDGDKYSCIHC